MTTEDYLLLCLIRHYQGRSVGNTTELIAVTVQKSYKVTQQKIAGLYQRGLVSHLLTPRLTALGNKVADGHYLIFESGRVSVGELLRLC